MKLIRKPEVIDAITIPDQWSPPALKAFSEWISERIDGDWKFDFHNSRGIIFEEKGREKYPFYCELGRMLFITEGGNPGSMNVQYVKEIYNEVKS